MQVLYHGAILQMSNEGDRNKPILSLAAHT